MGCVLGDLVYNSAASHETCSFSGCQVSAKSRIPVAVKEGVSTVRSCTAKTLYSSGSLVRIARC